jgi:lipid-A-disaccharide synthase
MKALKQEDPESDFRFWGGELMQAVGGKLVRHYSETAFMGFMEVVTNLDKIKANFKLCKSDLLEYQPDVLLLVDYPGFNLRMAEFAHKNGIKVYYYISPKIWAWNTGRVKKIKAYVDKMFTILPFETSFYKKHEVDIEYVGNPVLDAIESRENKNEDIEVFKSRNQLDNRPIIALLAGSRRQELNYVLPEMVKMVDFFPNYQFVIAGAPSFKQEDYKPFIADKEIKVIFNQTYEIVQQAHAALVTSGTATLETALLNCPQIVCYKMWGGKIFHKFLRAFILKVKHISLVNLILNKEGVKELVQENLNSDDLKTEINNMLTNQEYRIRIFNHYNDLRTIMGHPGTSTKAAKLITESLKATQH